MHRSAHQLLVIWIVLSGCASYVDSNNTTPPVESTSPPACTRVGQTWTSPADRMTLECVPAGEFWMGSAENDPLAAADEFPLRQVSLPAFWIDRTEVTNSMFAGCVAAGTCHSRTYSPYLWGTYTRWRDPYYGDPQYDNYPVIMLDGDEAEAYCHWAGRRLPSESEWEKAARGTDGRMFPWGEGIDCEKANYTGCSVDTTEVTAHPAGASPYGALDMAGNLWEWTSDWYPDEKIVSGLPPTMLPPHYYEYRALRGGSWGSPANYLRTAERASGKPEHWFDNQIGIRCTASSP